MCIINNYFKNLNSTKYLSQSTFIKSIIKQNCVNSQTNLIIYCFRVKRINNPSPKIKSRFKTNFVKNKGKTYKDILKAA